MTVVSAAPDLRADRRVAVAQAGATLPDGRRVETVVLRGTTSEGVLCTEADLDLGEEAGRVLELPGAAPGTALRELAGIRDTVVELEITANRGDLLSILGIARDLAAMLGTRIREPRVRLRELGAAAAEDVRVRIEEPALCPRYAARIVRGVSIGPAPFAVRLRLRRAGMRPINAIVDATNYVMLERGQPLHAFDLTAVAEGTVVVRRARAGERLVTLDDVERALAADDLVIADPRGPIALAGVMGGQASEVTAATRDVLLESAFFAPSTVRRTSRRLGLPSQAAYRFERRVDPEGIPAALDAAAAAIARMARGAVAPGRVEETPGMAALAPRPIRFRPERAQALLGIDVSPAEMRRRLRALGMACTREGDGLLVTPPSFRGDLAIEEDLAEEVARIGGYEAIPTTLPLVPAAGADEGASRRLARRVRQLLAAEGLSEMVTLSLTDPETNRLLPGWVGEGKGAGRAGQRAVVGAERAAPFAARRPGAGGAAQPCARRRLRRRLRGRHRLRPRPRRRGARAAGHRRAALRRLAAARRRAQRAARRLLRSEGRGAEPARRARRARRRGALAPGRGPGVPPSRQDRPRGAGAARRWGRPARCIRGSRRPSILQGKCGSLSLTSSR